MPSLLFYSRNRCTSVEQLDEKTIRSSCRLEDTLNEASVEITVRLPDLEIVRARGHMARSSHKQCLNTADSLQKVVGVRIGPGMGKIIKGLVGGGRHCGQVAFMVEECCHGVILAFTKDTLMEVPKEEARSKEVYATMLRENIRLFNRCAAFAPGSSLVEGIEPSK